MYYLCIFFIMKNNNTSSWALKELSVLALKFNDFYYLHIYKSDTKVGNEFYIYIIDLH